MGLKVLNPLIKAVSKKAYVAPKMEVRILESFRLEGERFFENTTITTPKLNFHFGIKVQPKVKIVQLGYLFKDSSTKFCEVSLKKSENINSYFSQFIDKLPVKYVETFSNGKRRIKDCLEIDTFEMLQKGNGQGSKKLQEIIKYAKDNYDGRLYLNAVKSNGYNSPVLFYYKNGLRSIDNEINVLLAKILNGKLPLSMVPNSAIMYLP